MDAQRRTTGRVERGGVGLHYVEHGGGNPPLLFIHGLGGDSSHFEPQLAHFGGRHRVVAVDLRGHGASDAPEAGYTVTALGDDVAAVCDALGLRGAVIVGHSLGAIVGLDLAARRPDLVSGLALIDAPILIPPAVAEALAPLGGELRGPRHREALLGFVGQHFFKPADDPARRQALTEALLAFPRERFVTLMEDMSGFDVAAAARALRAPALFVLATSPTDLAALRALLPTIQIEQTPEHGHYAQLEDPARVNALLERFLATTAG